jgi:MFS family permease
MTTAAADPLNNNTPAMKRLFWGCFIALVATSFAFIIRVMLMDEWQIVFGLSETQKGEIFGAGMWPFGVSIVLFSLLIDKFGYGRSMVFAFVCHVVSALLMIMARGYWWLYFGSILNGLAAGAVEAVINPAIATMYPKRKTTMLTILHAGWPGGFVLGGIAILFLKKFNIDWHVNVGIILVPTLLYGIVLFRAMFPVSERVAAGVSYRDMLKEAGALGWLIAIYMICMELNRVLGWGNLVDTTFFDLPSLPMTLVIVVTTGAYFAYTRSLGRPMYIFLLLVMILLAITELGTDTWIKELMAPAMNKLRLDSGWVLVYTATIMMVLRFCIGPIEKRLKPLGVLLASSLFAAAGLYFLSRAEGVMILLWATIYGTGQCFFWPVTLGLVAERFPRGGALTLNTMGGVGMLGVGILGSQLLGFWQDNHIDGNLKQQDPAAHVRLITKEPKKSIFGSYYSLDQDVINNINYKTTLYDFRQDFADKQFGGTVPTFAELDVTLSGNPKYTREYKQYQIYVRNAYDSLVRPEGDTTPKTHAEMQSALASAGAFISDENYADLDADRQLVSTVSTTAKKATLATVAILPLIMAACYLGLLIYFKVAQGGYKAIELPTEC